jgi:hypothetical protein
MCHLNQPSSMDPFIVIKEIVPGYTTCSYEVGREGLEGGQERRDTVTCVFSLQVGYDDMFRLDRISVIKSNTIVPLK